MAGHTFFGKQKLCYTEVSDFTDIQGIGHDPIYKRYDSVFSVVKRSIPTDYQQFLSTPEYLQDEDQICWHIDKWIEHPIRITELTGVEQNKYKAILEDTIRIYKSSVVKLNGEDLQILAASIKYIDESRVYCCDDKVYLVAWGMTPDKKQHKVIGSIIHEYEEIKRYKITFDTGDHGSLVSKLDKSINKAEGASLTLNDFPKIIVSDGYKFDGWSPSFSDFVVVADTTFVAKYIKEESDVQPEPSIIPPVIPPIEDPDEYFTCSFDAGEHGSIIGNSTLKKLANSTLSIGEIPSVSPNKGYKFKGWNTNPLEAQITSNKLFTAIYKKNIPWYRHWWLWFTGLFAGKGCLKWLLWLLIAILLLWLLSWLLRGCVGCSGFNHPVNGVVPIDTISTTDGRHVEDNGFIHPITGDNGKLPEDGDIVAPTLGEGGSEIPIISHPGVPNTIANRLFLFLENENDNIDALAQDFKKAYPSDDYSIIGYDKEVKLLVIQIPEDEREQIRKTINNKIPNHDFIVFDEEIYELHGNLKTELGSPGWHLNAIHLQKAWQITKGSADVKIAVVDDGIQSSHPMFSGRIVEAYNVFTQDNRLSLGDGHGTHTAGLAAGNSDYFKKGASGVAPNCKLMPIQVFDNKQCPLSALVAGVMYAIHHDADVVNISIGPSFTGLSQLPVEEQDQIARQQFKNVEKLWSRVCSLAAKKRTILVFAAGNDDILSSIPPENRNTSAIVVAALDKRLYPTDFTNYGPCSDISAPGKDILSSYPNNTFKSFDGTSMAAPIVTGTIALMKSLKKDITVTQARNVLYKTGSDVYGFIPPMVLVDNALMGVKRGDFSTPKERPIRPVPNGNGDKASGDSGSPAIDEPVNTQPAQKDETDYEAIRRKIAEYKKKISNLERLLPNK